MYQIHILGVSISRAQCSVNFREKTHATRYLGGTRKIASVSKLSKRCCVRGSPKQEKGQ